MKNLIKKILREDSGFLDSTEEDWEWAKGEVTDPFELYLNSYAYVGITINGEREDKISQEGLFSLNYRWGTFDRGVKGLSVRDANHHGLSYPYTLWVDGSRMLMYTDELDVLASDEIIIDNPFVYNEESN